MRSHALGVPGVPSVALVAALLAIGAAGCRETLAPDDPANDQIVFLSTRDGAMYGEGQLWEIYRINGDGSGLVNLTRQPGWYGNLNVTPDGRTLIFEGTRDFSPWSGSNCPTQVWAMGVDGSGLRKLTTQGCSGRPWLSPTGTLIAYQRSYQIWVLGTNGSGPYHVTHALPPVESTCGSEPSRWSIQLLGWTSDSHVMFSRHVCGVGTTYYTVDYQGNGLTEADGSMVSAYPSPDATQLAFTSAASGSTLNLSVMDVDGSNARVIAEDARLELRSYDGNRSPWSPDGTKLYFYNLDVSTNTRVHHIASASGPEVRPLTGLPSIPAFFNGWSPRGDRIAFTAWENGASNIYVINSDGTGAVNLTNSTARNERALWVPRR